MNTRTLVAIAAVLVSTGAVAMACGSGDDSNTTNPTCDPATQVCDDAGGDTDQTTADTSGEDVTLDTNPPLPDGTISDTIFIPPDGSVILPDGAVKLPDGAIITDVGGAFPCTPGGTQCTDCVDNDNDGLTDWMDPECTGPLDRDESSFSTGIPGDNKDACKQDCWFDGNSGSGDDGCLFNGECLVGSTDKSCPYDPEAAKDPARCPPPTKACMDYCRPLTPKGCDCAGCCDVYTNLPDGGTQVYTVKLVDGCTTESLGDPTKCPTCKKIPECSQPCGKCEWCLGKTSLPADCYPPPPPTDAGPDAPPPDGTTPDATPDTAPPPPTCEGGLQVCSPTAPCPTGYYCLTGCCIKAPA